MGVGVDGAMVDVTDYLDLDAGVTRSPWRESEFEDAAPSAFSFTLDNSDGRFTPGNPSSALATTVTEGMQVCWQLGSRLVAGTVQAIEPSFPGAESAWAQVTITCDDMLGNAARRTIGEDPLADLLEASGGGLRWPLDDPVPATSGLEGVRGVPAFVADNSTAATFGVSGSQLPFSPVVKLVTDGALGGILAGSPTPNNGMFPVPDYDTSTLGTWSGWFSLSDTDARYTIGAHYEGCSDSIRLNITPNGWLLSAGSASISAANSSRLLGGAHFASVSTSAAFAAGVWTLTCTARIDGEIVGSVDYAQASPATITSLTSAQRTPRYAFAYCNGAVNGSTAFAGPILFTESFCNEFALMGGTPAARLAAVASLAPEIELANLPAGLSTVPLAEDDIAGSPVLDVLNSVIRGEQGQIYSATSGTLTSPDEKITVRERDRVTDVDYTFNAETEAQGVTDFIRAITDTVSTATAEGPTDSATYTDSTLLPRVGSKNTSAALALRDHLDLYTWATDRVWRGANTQLRAASLTIDAMTTPTDRSADLLAMVPGDRIQITGLPSTQLGFSTWDGWLLGVEETHSTVEHTFTLYLQPVLPHPFILDTDVLAAGGNLTVTSDINSSVTSISVTSSDGTLITTTGGDFPLAFRIGSEVVIASGCSGASSPQTLTVSRGQTDPITGLATTAASHTAGDSIELADPAYLDF